MSHDLHILRRHGNNQKWSAKLVKDYDEVDKRHKTEIEMLIEDLHQLAVVRNYYIDETTLLNLHKKHMENT